jgi:hypothetical protein
LPRMEGVCSGMHSRQRIETPHTLHLLGVEGVLVGKCSCARLAHPWTFAHNVCGSASLPTYLGTRVIWAFGWLNDGHMVECAMAATCELPVPHWIVYSVPISRWSLAPAIEIAERCDQRRDCNAIPNERMRRYDPYHI